MEVFDTFMKSGSDYIEMIGLKLYLDLYVDSIKTVLYESWCFYVDMFRVIMKLDQDIWIILFISCIIIPTIVKKITSINSKKIINSQKNDITKLQTKLNNSYYEINKMNIEIDKIIHSYEETLKERDIKIIMLVNQLNNNSNKVTPGIIVDNGISMVDKYSNTINEKGNIKCSVNLQDNDIIKSLQDQIKEKDKRYSKLFDEIADKQKKLNNIEKQFNLLRNK